MEDHSTLYKYNSLATETSQLQEFQIKKQYIEKLLYYTIFNGATDNNCHFSRALENKCIKLELKFHHNEL